MPARGYAGGKEHTMGIKRWLLLGGIAAGIGTVLVLRQRRSGYDMDEIDAPGDYDDPFGERRADAPEQRWAPAETRHDVTVEELSTASRVETSWDDIHTTWPSVTLEEARSAEGDLDRLAGLIAEKVEQPRDQVRQKLDEIIAQDTPDPSFPAH
jgi:hypothetical protein